jgi:hypothetical protein
MFTPNVAGAYRQVKVSGKEIYLRLGEMTQQEYKGNAFCTRKNVIAVRVDINGNPIDDAMHFVPDPHRRSWCPQGGHPQSLRL